MSALGEEMKKNIGKTFPDFENRTLQDHEEYRVRLIATLVSSHTKENIKDFEEHFDECMDKFKPLKGLSFSNKDILQLIHFAMVRRVENEST